MTDERIYELRTQAAVQRDRLAKEIFTKLQDGCSWMEGYPEDIKHVINRANNLAAMCHSKSWPAEKKNRMPPIDNDVDWLINQIAQRYDKFPSQAAFRRIYCEQFPPKDGIEI